MSLVELGERKGEGWGGRVLLCGEDGDGDDDERRLGTVGSVGLAKGPPRVGVWVISVGVRSPRCGSMMHESSGQS